MTQTLAESSVHTTGSASERGTSLLRRAAPIAVTVAVSFGIVALQLAQGILLARLLGPQGRGEYATAVLYVQMLLYVGLFGAIEVVCRYAADEKVDRHSLRRAGFGLALLTGGITTVVAIGCSLIGLPSEKQYLWPLSLICSLAIVGQHVMLILSAVDRGAGDFRRYNRLRLVAAAAFPMLLVLWAIVAQATLLSTCALFVTASVLSAVPYFLGLNDRPGAEPAPAPAKLFREGRPYALSMLATDIVERLDLLLMLWLAPLITQGFYNAMIPVAYPLTVIPNTLGLFLFNAGARQGSGLSARRLHHIVLSSVGIQIAMTFAFLILVGPVVKFFYGEEFSPAIRFAMWLAPVAAIKGIVQSLESYVKGRGRPLASIRIRLVSAVVMLIATAALYRISGILSIVQGSLVGQIVCLFGLLVVVYSDVRSGGSQNPDSVPRAT